MTIGVTLGRAVHSRPVSALTRMYLTRKFVDCTKSGVLLSVMVAALVWLLTEVGIHAFWASLSGSVFAFLARWPLLCLFRVAQP